MLTRTATTTCLWLCHYSPFELVGLFAFGTGAEEQRDQLGIAQVLRAILLLAPARLVDLRPAVTDRSSAKQVCWISWASTATLL